MKADAMNLVPGDTSQKSSTRKKWTVAQKEEYIISDSGNFTCCNSDIVISHSPLLCVMNTTTVTNYSSIERS